MIADGWLYCEGTIVFGRNDVAGLEFVADHTWYFLLKREDGSLLRGQGFNNVGTWDTIDMTGANGPGSFQLNLELPSGGNAVFATFATTPKKVFLASMGGNAEYASLSE